MRTAILSAHDPARHRGGIESYILALRELLEEDGDQVEIVHADGLTPDVAFNNELLGRLFTLGRLFAGREREFDRVISNGFYGLGWFPRSTPSVNIYHSTYAGFGEAVRDCLGPATHFEWTGIYGHMGEAASGLYARRVAVSGAVARELDEHYGLDGARIAPSGVDLQRFAPTDRALARKALDVSGTGPWIAYVGRWDATKGVDLIEELVAAELGWNWLLVLASGGQDCPLANHPRVRVHRDVEPGDIPGYLNASDAMLFPSRYEGFGLAVIEALACGVPVVSTPVGVVRDLAPQLRDWCLPDWREGRAALVAAARENLGKVLNRPPAADAVRALVNPGYGLAAWRSAMREALGS